MPFLLESHEKILLWHHLCLVPPLTLSAIKAFSTIKIVDGVVVLDLQSTKEEEFRSPGRSFIGEIRCRWWHSGESAKQPQRGGKGVNSETHSKHSRGAGKANFAQMK